VPVDVRLSPLSRNARVIEVLRMPEGQAALGNCFDWLDIAGEPWVASEVARL